MPVRAGKVASLGQTSTHVFNMAVAYFRHVGHVKTLCEMAIPGLGFGVINLKALLLKQKFIYFFNKMKHRLSRLLCRSRILLLHFLKL
jgi:hypothetical protein